MDEFGETPTFYIWPEGHEEGQPFPEDFLDRVRKALTEAGLDFESV